MPEKLAVALSLGDAERVIAALCMAPDVTGEFKAVFVSVKRAIEKSGGVVEYDGLGYRVRRK